MLVDKLILWLRVGHPRVHQARRDDRWQQKVSYVVLFNVGNDEYIYVIQSYIIWNRPEFKCLKFQVATFLYDPFKPPPQQWQIYGSFDTQIQVCVCDYLYLWCSCCTRRLLYNLFTSNIEVYNLVLKTNKPLCHWLRDQHWVMRQRWRECRPGEMKFIKWWTLMNVHEQKWNESGFRPPLCTYRLNWARRTSWGWWDDWDDTVIQTQDSKFEPWGSEAEHATSRSRRLPTILTFSSGWGRNIFVSFKPPRPEPSPRPLAWKPAVLTITLGPPPCSWTFMNIH